VSLIYCGIEKLNGFILLPHGRLRFGQNPKAEVDEALIYVALVSIVFLIRVSYDIRTDYLLFYRII
jgi:hypothetical protein